MGIFSFPLYERLTAAAPEFEQVAAFQAGGRRLSVRRAGVEPPARPLRSEYVTGNYFSTLGVGAFGGRVFTPNDDKLAPGHPRGIHFAHERTAGRVTRALILRKRRWPRLSQRSKMTLKMVANTRSSINDRPRSPFFRFSITSPRRDY